MKDVESNIDVPKLVHLELEGLWLLPAEVLVGEMTILGGLEIDWLGKVELLDDHTWTKVEVVADDLDQLVRRLVRCTIGVNEDRQRLSDTDGV